MEVVAAPLVLLADELAAPGWVRLDGDRIVAAGRGRPPNGPTRQLRTGVLAPGLVDLQLNGAFGHNFATASEQDWREITRRLPSTGVTSFVPTVITAPLGDLADVLERFGRVQPELDCSLGARPVGMHVEGPFLAAGRRGAHRSELLLEPTRARVQRLLAAGAGQLVALTLAPELPGAMEAVRILVDAGVRVAIGHSDASDAEVFAAADAGAGMVTHLFNAQSPLHHRAPGVVGAALADPRLVLGLIVDLHHVAPTAVRVAFAAAADRIALVSDAITALGMPPGEQVLGGQRVTIREAGPPLLDDGAIAGSALRMDTALGNTVACGIDAASALTAATRVPADAIGRPDLGRLSPGAAADLVWLDNDWHALATWVSGQLVHVDEERPASRDLAPRPRGEGATR